jgi:hypothetical protein
VNGARVRRWRAATAPQGAPTVSAGRVEGLCQRGPENLAADTSDTGNTSLATQAGRRDVA